MPNGAERTDWLEKDRARIDRVVLRGLRLPLVRPYKLSYRTFHEFEPIIAEVHLDDGRIGWGEGHISPGSSTETREGGWQFVETLAPELPGLSAAEGRARVLRHAARSPVAATSLASAIEMAVRHPHLACPDGLRVPLLTPINASDPGAIADEIEDWLAQGFRTFKVKVGQSVRDDLLRVEAIQRAVNGRATLRLDANRGFDRAQALAFVSGLDPAMIELFEQPCATDAWDDNAAVAAASPVPLMLDEPICSLDDIDRAAAIPGVGFCKVKLKRFSSAEGLRAALDAIRAHGMRPVLGDGLSSDLACWMEACIGAGLIHGAGEFNGFLKLCEPLLSPPLRFADGHLAIEPGYAPRIDWAAKAGSIVREVPWDRGRPARP